MSFDNDRLQLSASAHREGPMGRVGGDGCLVCTLENYSSDGWDGLESRVPYPSDMQDGGGRRAAGKRSEVEDLA